MKYIQSILLFTFFFISYSIKAQHVGTINDFEILPAYLTNGQVRISGGTTTTLKYKVTFVRETATTYPTLTWKPFNMTVGLSTADANGNIVVLEDGTKIIGDNFPSATAFLDKEFTITIENSKLIAGRPIILYYKLNETSLPIYSYNSKVYSLTNATPPDPTLPTDSIPVYAVYHASSGGTEYTQDLPSSGAAIAFYAPRFNQRGSKPVFRDWINYSSGFPTLDYTYNFIGTYPNYYEFSAFTYPAPNTAPIYKISDLSGRNILYAYRLDRLANQKIHEVAFYAYPYSRRGPIGQEKWRQFEAAPQEWTALTGGNGYSVSLKSVFPGLTINGATSASILVQTGPRGGKTPLNLPQTFENRSFNFEYVNGDIIVTTDGSQPDKVYEFRIDYL